MIRCTNCGNVLKWQQRTFTHSNHVITSFKTDHIVKIGHKQRLKWIMSRNLISQTNLFFTTNPTPNRPEPESITGQTVLFRCSYPQTNSILQSVFSGYVDMKLICLPCLRFNSNIMINCVERVESFCDHNTVHIFTPVFCS